MNTAYIRGWPWPDRRRAGQIEALLDRLQRLRSTLTAFSAGTDSTLLAMLAHAALGEQSLAATAVSVLLPQTDMENAKKLSGQYGFRRLICKATARAA